METETKPDDTPGDDLALARAEKNWLKKIYFWCLHWARTPYAIPVLFVIAIIESSIFPIPPDVLLVAICFAAPKSWWKAALACTIGSVLGGIAGYYIGYALYEKIGLPIVQFYNGEEVMHRIEGWYHEYGFMGVILAAITPIPYKVFTIASGVFKFDLWLFILASFLGRGFRFFAEALVIRIFGEKVRPLLEKHFNLFMWLFGALAILGFLALKVF